ncbi:lipase, partial [Elysia marginata]
MLLVVFVTTLLSVAVQVATNMESLKFFGEAITSRSGSRLGRNPEVNMNTTELIRSKGYPVETHKVVTQDGYILTVFRIPHGRQNKNSKDPRPVVYLQHGLIAFSDNFIANPVNESLGFLLADVGADVWLGNTRGNIYGREHTTLDPKSLEFWKFSWDEMAQYDLPATIYYILNQTGHEQLYYVGHSQGTAIGFARFGEDLELASRVKHFIALAPVARVGNTKSPIRLLVPFSTELVLFLDTFGHGEFDIPEPLLKFLAGNLCERWGEIICENFLFLLCGYNTRSFNTSRSDVYISHGEGGASARNLLQWAQ